MKTPHTRCRNAALTTCRGIALAAALCGTGSALAEDTLFATRTYNPFTQIFGRPAFYGGSVLPAGKNRVSLTTNITSHTEPALSGTEQLELDGESYHLNLTADRGMSARWELGVRVPYIGHSGGFLDATVEAWHDVIGAPNDQRDVRPRDQLNFIYARDGEILFARTESTHGFGDVELRSAWRLLGANGEKRRLAARAGLKLPTGSARALRGSGAADVSLGLGYTDSTTLAAINTTITAHAGMLLLGEGDVLPELQRSQVPFGGVQLAVAFGQRFDLIGQVQTAGAYYDSALSTLGGESVQLSVGGHVRFPQSGWRCTFGIVEDAFSDMAPDFALHLEISKSFGVR